MDRMQILLPNTLRQMIRLRAQQTNKPQVEIVRELLQKGLEASQDRAETAGDGLLRLVRLGERLHVKLPADLSRRIDDYLYGENK